MSNKIRLTCAACGSLSHTDRMPHEGALLVCMDCASVSIVAGRGLDVNPEMTQASAYDILEMPLEEIARLQQWRQIAIENVEKRGTA